MRVHLAGGEPTGDWPRLLGIIRAARDAGLSPLEKIETNAGWAADDNLTRARLEQLDALGMEHLIISADAYHQEFIGHDRVARLFRIAQQVLGGPRVVVRRSHFARHQVDARRMTDPEKAALFERAAQRYADRLTGRAADRLASFFQRFPAEHFSGRSCEKEILRSRHVHIDPFGNVFPGVCAGILFGNARQTPLDELWEEVARNWRENPVLDAVVTGGSAELARRATALGFRELPEGYASKCHLCSHVRQFLVERGGWERWLGPAECYPNTSDRREAARWNDVVTLTRGGREMPVYGQKTTPDGRAERTGCDADAAVETRQIATP